MNNRRKYIKYKIRKDLKLKLNFVALYRIEALKDFNDIKKGDIGGYIEKETNLSQNDNAWVYGDARVYGDAQVSGDARVYGNAQVSSNAQVYGDAQVSGNAWVSSNARVSGNAWVSSNARVSGNAWVYGNACVSGDAQVYGNACVSGNAWVYGNARVYGDAQVSGDAQVYGKMYIREFDEISHVKQYFNILGFKYFITVTYCSIHIGCLDFTLDQLDTVIEHDEFTQEEIQRIKIIIEVVLNQILEKL